jgi:ER lumen protein retaining receptor
MNQACGPAMLKFDCVPGFYDNIAIVAGCVQTILYCDFFYLYVTRVLKGKKLQLPA